MFHFLRSSNSEPLGAPLAHLEIFDRLDPAALREALTRVAHPRHFVGEAEQNSRTVEMTAETFRSLGYETVIYGEHRSVIAFSAAARRMPSVAGVAHLDSVRRSPGANDNGSALIGLEFAAIEAAEVDPDQKLPLVWVAPNREEDGFLGSEEVVAKGFTELGLDVSCAHVLEMIGCRRREPGSQAYPPMFENMGLPTVGDFLAVVANTPASTSLELACRLARGNLERELDVLALTVPEAIVAGEGLLGYDLFRSDHVPFWRRGRAATMWTDTSNFRYQHYHGVTDTPDKIDYGFLREVTFLFSLTILNEAAELARQNSGR